MSELWMKIGNILMLWCLFSSISLAKAEISDSILVPDFELGRAVQANDIQKVQRLLAEEVDVNTVSDTNYRTALHWSMNPEISELLIKHGAYIEAKDDAGRTPLHHIVVELSNIVNADPVSSAGQLYGEIIPLRSAIPPKIEEHSQQAKQMLSQLKILLQNGARADTVDRRGDSPIYEAVKLNNSELLSIFAKYQVDFNLRHAAFEGNTALHGAITLGHRATDVIEILLANDADVNSKNSNLETPLHLVCLHRKSYEQPDEVKLLLRNGADVNAKNQRGRTPIFYATTNEDSEVMKLLVEHGADINIPDNYGITALHNAVLVGSKEGVKFLLEKKADLSIADQKNRTPLDSARGQHHSSRNKAEIESMLTEAIKNHSNEK